jgi:hypothetical protein
VTQFRYSSSLFVALVVLMSGLGVSFCSSAFAAETETPDDSPGADEEVTPKGPEAQGNADSEQLVARQAEEVALEAQRVHSEYCGSLQGADRGLAGESFAVVGPAWSRVSEAYRATEVIYLLYWSGLLSECLGRRHDAVSDLEAFLGDDASRPLVSMVADARWRLRRGTRGKAGTATMPRKRRPRSSVDRVRRGGPRFIPGIGLGIAAVVGGVVAGGEWSHANQFHIPDVNKGDAGAPRWALDADMQSATESAMTAQLVGGISAGLALSSVVSLIVAAAVGPRERERGEKTSPTKETRLNFAPGPSGVFLGVSSRW